MRRVQAGDAHAFEVLVHEYQGLVLSLCRRYLGSRAPAVEDVAQEVFVRIYQGRMGYQPRARVKTWIFSIAVNACLNEIRRLRSRKHRSVVPFTAVFGDGSGGDGAPVPGRSAGASGAGLEEAEVAARVRTAVDALPEQQRLALVLSRFHHCGYEEIAETLETSVPAVKSLLTRARHNLMRELADLVEGEGAVLPARGDGVAGREPSPRLRGKGDAS